MDAAPRKTPIRTSFQFRDDERAGMEALFERTFFDVPFRTEQEAALLRTRFAEVSPAADGDSGAGAGGTAGADARGESKGAAVEATGAATTESGRTGGEAGENAGGGASPAGQAQPAESGVSARYIVLYRGANGIGKTRAFRQFRESARSRAIPVYEVHCHDVEGIPFKPFLHALRAALRDHDKGAVLREKYRHALEGLIPELFPETPSRDDPEWITPERLAAERARVFDGITQLLLELTARRPMLLLVHDLHWSDAPTIELLRYIGRNLELRGRSRDRSGDRAVSAIEGSSEVEDLGEEGDEWRSLGGGSVLAGGQLQHLLRVSESPHDDVSEPPSRLMVLANYRGSDDPSHYLEKAIVSLGRESYAYHGELRTLRADEAGTVIRGALDGAQLDGAPVEVDDAAVRAIYEASEGFPSYTQELLQALYHGEGTDHRAGGEREWSRAVWSAELVESTVAGARQSAGFSDAAGSDAAGSDAAGSDAATLADPVDETSAAEESTDTSPPTDADASPKTAPDSAAGSKAAEAGANAGPEATGADGTEADAPRASEETPRRGDILRVRLQAASPEEIAVLRVLASAQRPLTPGAIGRVLAGLDGSAEEGPPRVDVERVVRLLEGLLERGLLERAPVPTPGAGDSPDAYFFRLWDYVDVVVGTIPEEEKTRTHEQLGELGRELSAEGRSDAAYEVFYHLYRGEDPRACVTIGLAAARWFLLSLALEKAREVHDLVIGLLDVEEDADRRIALFERQARISLALDEGERAEGFLRQAQEAGASKLGPERLVELLLLESEAVGRKDPARGIKVLGKVSKLLPDVVSRLGARVQLQLARMRLRRDDIKRAINLALKGRDICQKLGEEFTEQGELFRVLASTFYRKGDYAHAVDNYQRALAVFEQLGAAGSAQAKVSLVATLDELGRVYMERGNYFRAARYLYRSLEARRQEHEVAGLCRSYDALGRVYLRSGDYIKTIENLNLSLSLKERVGDFAGLHPTLSTLGELYARLGLFENSLGYFERAVSNAQKLGDTPGLVDALARLGRVWFELSDYRRAESLSKQVEILASEFQLRTQEADGKLLAGRLCAVERDWTTAEKLLRQAAEIHAKLGHRRREADSLLQLADLKVQRELWDEGFKVVAKGQIIAEELRAQDLQVRALVTKGNIHRFLKGGNTDKARECFQKALELGQSLADVRELFLLFYSLAKLSHSEREFSEAANYYGKAELLVRQVGRRLPGGLSSRFFEDPRRREFAEDIARFRREAARGAPGGAIDLRDSAVRVTQERPVGVQDLRELARRIQHLNSGLNQLHFYDRLLADSLELSGADRGFILRVESRQYLPVAFHGFGPGGTQHPEFMIASQLTQESIRKGQPIAASGRPETGKDAGRRRKKERDLPLGYLVHRSVLAVPFATDDRIFGGVYLDKPVALGEFGAREQGLLESFGQHAAVALGNRREFETAIREPVTGFYNPSYFVARLRDTYRLYNLHGKSFALVGYYVPNLDDMLGEGRGQLAGNLSRELGEVLPERASVCWGSPVLCVLLDGADAQAAEEIAERARRKLCDLLHDDVASATVPVSRQFQQGADIYYEVRRQLLPEECDQRTLSALRGMLGPEVTLRDAKRIVERLKIETTLRKTGGNVTHAARELGVHRPQLSNLLKKHELRRERFEPKENEEEVGGEAEDL